MSPTSNSNIDGGAMLASRKEKTSSFLSKLMNREKGQVRPKNSSLQSTDQLPETLTEIHESALQVHLDFSSTTADLETRIARLSVHLSNILPMVAALHKAQGEAGPRMIELEDENLSLKKALTEIQEDLADHKSKLSDAVARSNRLVEERERLRGEVEGHQRERVELCRLKETFELQLETALLRTGKLDQHLIELEEENGRLKEGYLDAKRLVASLTNDVSEAKIAIEARDIAYERTKKILEEEKAYANRAKSELIRADNDGNAMRAQIVHLQAELAAVSSRLEGRIEKMAHASASIERDRDAARARLAVVERINASQKRKVDRAQAHINHLQALLRRLIKEGAASDGPFIDLDFEPEIEDKADAKMSNAESTSPLEYVDTDDSVIQLPPRRK